MDLMDSGYYKADKYNGVSLRRYLQGEDPDLWGENEPLNIVKLKHWSDLPDSQIDIAWGSYVSRCKSGKGWFSRWKDALGPYSGQYRTNSHDNLKAVCAMSEEDAYDIANVLLLKLCTYNDKTKKIDFKEFMRPDALVYACLRSKSKLHNILGLTLSPILIGFIVGSTIRKKDTAKGGWFDYTNSSGKWLAKIMLDSLQDYFIFRLLRKFFYARINKLALAYTSFDENGKFDRVVSGFKAVVYDFNMRHQERGSLDVQDKKTMLRLMLDEYRS